MVGDIAAAHRQGDPVAAAAVQGCLAGSQAQQEVGQPLRRLQAGQCKCIVLGRIQLLAGALQQLAFQVRVTLAQIAHLRGRHPADPAVGNRLDIVAMVVAAAQAQIIARQYEAVHLAATVGQGAHQAQRALGYCIDISARLTGTRQRSAHGDWRGDGYLLQRMYLITGQGRAHRQVANRALQALAPAIAFGGNRRNGVLLGALGWPGHVYNRGGGCPKLYFMRPDGRCAARIGDRSPY